MKQSAKCAESNTAAGRDNGWYLLLKPTDHIGFVNKLHNNIS